MEPIMLPVEEVKAPDVLVTISVWKDGRRNIHSEDPQGKTCGLGEIRDALREATNKIEDQFLVTLAHSTALKMLEDASETKDRNGLARFLQRFR
jgi:hypothetical protein